MADPTRGFDADRTVFIPTPGKQTRGGAAAGPAPDGARLPPLPAAGGIADGARPATMPPLIGDAANPLIGAATMLWALVQTLRQPTRPRDVEALRRQAIQALKDMKGRATDAGAGREHVATACFAMAALLDETVQHRTPWGLDSVWRDRNLLTLLYGEALAGDHVFELLRQALDYPHANLPLLEFLYVILAFGFEGRYRVIDGGIEELGRLKEKVYHAIRRERGDPEAALSPHWQGASDPAPKALTAVPLWVTLAAAAAALLGLFLYLNLRLADQSQLMVERANAIMAGRARPQLMPEAPTISAELGPIARLRRDLAGEIDRGLVRVEDLGGAGRLTLSNADSLLFAEASASVGPTFVPIIATASRVLATLPGPVAITGHSDNRPIRTAEFPSNARLSEARADAVAARLRPLLPREVAIDTAGMADTEAIAPNDTADNRARNRRVEIRFPLAPPASR